MGVTCKVFHEKNTDPRNTNGIKNPGNMAATWLGLIIVPTSKPSVAEEIDANNITTSRSNSPCKASVKSKEFPMKIKESGKAMSPPIHASMIPTHIFAKATTPIVFIGLGKFIMLENGTIQSLFGL